MNDAEQMLTDAAGGKVQTTIEKNNDGSRTAKLSDGRWICVEYNDEGEIEKIHISTDTKKHDEFDGNGIENFDASEVAFANDGAFVEGESRDEQNHNYRFEFTLTDGYDFEKYKKLAEQIFKDE